MYEIEEVFGLPHATRLLLEHICVIVCIYRHLLQSLRFEY